ncbi:MAG: Holliday junction resolvase RuvX [Rickettsiales bacterium]
MIYNNSEIDKFIIYLKPNQPILGIDFGERLIGIAKTDRSRFLSNPYAVIKGPGFDDISTIVLKEKICGIVIGYPLSMDGTEGENCKKVNKYSAELLKRFNLPIYLQDERLTTKAAKAVLKDSHLSRKEKDFLDNKIAASIILESFLDFAKNR